MNPVHVALAVAVAAAWGVNFVVIKVGLDGMPPLLLCALRFLLAAIPAVLFVPRPMVRWQMVALYGFVLGVVKFGLLFTAMKVGISPGLASLVLQAQAFFTIIFVALLGERIGVHQLFGLVLAASGIVLIGSSADATLTLPALGMALAAAAAWGVANIITKQAGNVNMLSFIVWASLVPPVPLFALSVSLDGWQTVSSALTHLNWASIGSVLFLAYIATIAGFGVWSALIARYSASQVAPFSLLVPIFGMVSSAVFLRESFGPLKLLAACLVVMGLIVNVFGARFLPTRRFV